MNDIPPLTPYLGLEYDGEWTIHFKPWGAGIPIDDATDRIDKITSGVDPTLPDVTDSLDEPLLDKLKAAAAQHLKSIEDQLP